MLGRHHAARLEPDAVPGRGGPAGEQGHRHPAAELLHVQDRLCGVTRPGEEEPGAAGAFRGGSGVRCVLGLCLLFPPLSWMDREDFRRNPVIRDLS